ncbi:MAG: hypothetical protein LUH23_09305 [Oscillospiraceae bacterium]|nr:hypothetical protein [Oscillospiraceae bacterium]
MNKIIFNPNDLKGMRILVKTCGNSSEPFCGENGEPVTISVFSDRIIVVTTQSNGWSRINTYYSDGTAEERQSKPSAPSAATMTKTNSQGFSRKSRAAAQANSENSGPANSKISIPKDLPKRLSFGMFFAKVNIVLISINIVHRIGARISVSYNNVLLETQQQLKNVCKIRIV